jgi:electron transfer flavoprotein beta subunit
MNIVVLVKQVPDSSSARTLSADRTVGRASASNIVNEMDEYAVEEALKIKEAHGGEVTVLTMGPAGATESIRKALSMGPDRAVHVIDDALHGSCALTTSKVLAAALRRLNADLVICGAESTDGRVQVMPQMLAERLGVAAVTGARKLVVDGNQLTAERQTDEGNEPRYPSFKGIMAAKKKPVETLSLADLGVEAGATSVVLDFTKRPPRSAGQKVTDNGDGGALLVAYLAAEKLV